MVQRELSCKVEALNKAMSGLMVGKAEYNTDSLSARSLVDFLGKPNEDALASILGTRKRVYRLRAPYRSLGSSDVVGNDGIVPC
jgi:hypothetical protein